MNLENLKNDLIKYCNENNIDVEDVKFKNSAEWFEFKGYEADGGFSYESSGLYRILNFLDVAGDFSYSKKHLEAIERIFDKNGFWYEPCDNCSSAIFKI